MLKQITATLCGLILAGSIGCGKQEKTYSEAQMNYSLQQSKRFLSALGQKKHEQILGPTMTTTMKTLYEGEAEEGIKLRLLEYRTTTQQKELFLVQYRMEVVDNNEMLVMLDQVGVDFKIEKADVFVFPKNIWEGSLQGENLKQAQIVYENIWAYLYKSGKLQQPRGEQKNYMDSSYESSIENMIQFTSNDEDCIPDKQEPQQQPTPIPSPQPKQEEEIILPLEVQIEVIFDGFISSMNAHVQWYKETTFHKDGKEMLRSSSMVIVQDKNTYIISDVTNGDKNNVIDKAIVYNEEGEYPAQTPEQILSAQTLYNRAKIEIMWDTYQNFFKQHTPKYHPPFKNPWHSTPTPTPEPKKEKEEKKQLKGVHTSYFG